MAAFDFPAVPGDQSPENIFSPTSTPYATSNGTTYEWKDGAWRVVGGGSGGGGAVDGNAHVGETPPDVVDQGTLWWHSGDGNLLINYDEGDGGSEQWVAAATAAGPGLKRCHQARGW